MKAAGVPIVPGHHRAGRDRRGRAEDRQGRDRLPGRSQGRRRRRRQGLPGRAHAGRARGRLRGRKPRRREVLLRRHRLRRALPARPPPRRGPGARRPPRQRDPPRRARLLDPAPPPEADRGVAGAAIVDEALRDASATSASRPRAAVDYVGAGTIEGLLQDGEEYFFLEMNTRVQVEHCVTEMTTGIDIVKEGIRVGGRRGAVVSQEDVVLRGHAIECRINAEDASKNFAPAPGKIGPYREPSGPGVRVDSGVGRGRRSFAHVRPDGRQADRLGRRPRAGDKAHAAGAGRIRDRGAEDPDPLPQGAAWHRAVGARRDLQGPAGGPQVAEAARVRAGCLGAGGRGGRPRSSTPTRSRFPASASMCA